MESPVGSDSSSRRTKAELVSTDHARLLVIAVTSAWRVTAQNPPSSLYDPMDAWGFHRMG